MTRTILSWSSGKDSGWTLHVLRRSPAVEVVGLVSTINQSADRVAMHAVRRSLLLLQAERAGLPIEIVPLPYPCSNRQYEAAMSGFLQAAARDKVDHVAFGDLFLEDVRDYRRAQFEGTGLVPSFPVWGSDTHRLAREMFENGFRARVTCVDPKQLDASFCGREFDHQFVDDLPPNVDPCGENGEFHTFLYDAPFFSAPIGIRQGPVVERDGFVFADFEAAGSA